MLKNLQERFKICSNISAPQQQNAFAQQFYNDKQMPQILSVFTGTFG